MYLIDVFRGFRFQYELLKHGGAVGERAQQVTLLTGLLSVPNIITFCNMMITFE
jgi:hypothetical protein